MKKRCLKYLRANNADQMRGGCFHVQRVWWFPSSAPLIYDNSKSRRDEETERGRMDGGTMEEKDEASLW